MHEESAEIQRLVRLAESAKRGMKSNPARRKDYEGWMRLLRVARRRAASTGPRQPSVTSIIRSLENHDLVRDDESLADATARWVAVIKHERDINVTAAEVERALRRLGDGPWNNWGLPAGGKRRAAKPVGDLGAQVKRIRQLSRGL